MFDPVLLRTFLAVVRTRNFTRAAAALGLRQSTVSQQVRRLEATAGRALFSRDTHTVRLTVDGEALVPLADRILAAHDRAADYFTGEPVRGLVRFGVSEDVVASRLPEILRDFRAGHPQVEVELTVALSGVLHEAWDRRALDLVFAKRRVGQEHGTLVWRERLAWVGAGGFDPDRPVPLIAYPPPSITRARAIESLQRHDRPWRITCTSGSLSGLRAAALAGLGVTVHAHGLIPPGLTELAADYRLPDLGDVEFILLGAVGAAAGGPVAALAATILAAGERLQSTT